MKNNVKQYFVVFQSKNRSEMVRLDSINRISVDTTTHLEYALIDKAYLLINDELWDSFNNVMVDIDLDMELQNKILNAINENLLIGSNKIDLDSLVRACVKELKREYPSKEEKPPLIPLV